MAALPPSKTKVTKAETKASEDRIAKPHSRERRPRARANPDNLSQFFVSRRKKMKRPAL
jgi:hypothetical protein